MDFEDYCIQGDRADDLYKKKDFDKAEKEYHAMLKTMHGSGEIDSYIVSKITLGLLLTYIKKGEYDKAFEIWNSDPESNIFGIGVMGLGETFQVSMNDSMVYYFVYTFLYTLLDEEPSERADRIAEIMIMIINYAKDNDENILPQAISNWKQFLTSVFDVFIPQQYTDQITEIETELGATYPLIDIDFPNPSEWIVDWDAEESVISDSDDSLQE